MRALATRGLLGEVDDDPSWMEDFPTKGEMGFGGGLVRKWLVVGDQHLGQAVVL